ncbi:sel1 repeat family protein [Brevundimonas sp. BH3]|uniref:sel1 repeat family protein n=1 Tax=unclassified Brevundimonas TaxID=2622653 RepID=UPI0028A19F10|nr:sel1 repeat family protein [Brevundimonas sp.]
MEGLTMIGHFENAADLVADHLPLPTPEMDGEALFKLGLAYSSGQDGCPLDRVSAHMIFNLAALKGSLEARSYRKEMSEEMCSEELAEAQRAARRWIDNGSTGCAA